MAARAKAAASAATLTDAQKTARTNRRHEIHERVQGSGEASSPDHAVELAKTIETFEFADGDINTSDRRKALVTTLMGSGRVKMADVVETAKAQLDALEDFS